MGENVSWLAVADGNKFEALKSLGLKDTGEPDPYRDAMLSAATLKTGWTIIFSRSYDWIDEDLIGRANMHSAVVAVREADHGDVYQVSFYDNGELTWMAGFYGELKTHGYIFDLQDAIERCQADWEDDDIDFGDDLGMSGVPAELAYMTCGFKRSDVQKEMDQPSVWTRVEPLS